MAIEDQIRDEKLQYDINREVIYSRLININILLVNKYCLLINNKIIEQAKFTYSPLGKAFEKQTKRIEDQGEKRISVLKSLESSEKQLPSIKDFISKERCKWCKSTS